MSIVVDFDSPEATVEYNTIRFWCVHRPRRTVIMTCVVFLLLVTACLCISVDRPWTLVPAARFMATLLFLACPKDESLLLL